MAITTKASLSFYTNGLTADYNTTSAIRPSANGDLGCDTGLKVLRVGDGATRGGIPIPSAQNFFSQVTSGGNVTLGNHFVYVANAGSTVTLPAVNANNVYHGVGSLFYGRRYIIVHNSGASVTVTDNGSFEVTLSDASNEYKSIEVMSTGSSWVIINSSLNPVAF